MTGRNFFRIPHPILSERRKEEQYITKQDLKSKVAAAIAAIFNADNRPHAEARLANFIKSYSETQPKLAEWAETNIPEGFAVFNLPAAHRKKIRTSNAYETLNSQINGAHESSGFSPTSNPCCGKSPEF